jgi:hypothetical protein
MLVTDYSFSQPPIRYNTISRFDNIELEKDHASNESPRIGSSGRARNGGPRAAATIERCA